MVRVVEAASCHFPRNLFRHGLLDVKRQDTTSINPYAYWLHSNNLIPSVRILEGLLREKGTSYSIANHGPVCRTPKDSPPRWCAMYQTCAKIR